MKRNLFLSFVAVCLCSLAVFAGAKYKFKSSVDLLENGSQVRMQSLRIAAGDNCYGVVYDTFWTGRPGSNAYFMIIDGNGKVLSQPVKLGAKQHVMDPHIAYGNGTFVIITSAGKQLGQWDWDLDFYVSAFNKSGKKLSSRRLDMIPARELDGLYTKIVWTGTDFAVFYFGATSVKGWVDQMCFVNIDASGKPGKSTMLEMDQSPFFNVIWDGERFVLVQFGWEYKSYDKARFDVWLLDRDGSTLDNRMIEKNALVYTYYGVSIVQTHKKGQYLLAYCMMPPGANSPGVSPASHWYDVYTSVLSVKGGLIDDMSSPRNVTLTYNNDWSFPTLLRNGKNYYLTAMLTWTGCSQGYVKLSAKGKSRGKPLTNVVPGPVCGQWPPYAAFLNGECGYVYWNGTIKFNAVIP